MSIVSGVVKIYDCSSQSEERTVALFSQNHIYPIDWLMNPLPAHTSYYYKAFTDVTCIEVDHSKLMDFVSKRADLLLMLLSVLSQGYLNVTARIVSLVSSDLEERIYFILYYLATRLSNNGAKGTVEIEANITHSDIAMLVGATREATSAKLSKFKKAGVYWKKNGHTYIDFTKIVDSKIPTLFRV